MRITNDIWSNVDMLVGRDIDPNCQNDPWREIWDGLWDQVDFEAIFRIVEPLTVLLKEISNEACKQLD